MGVGIYITFGAGVAAGVGVGSINFDVGVAIVGGG